MFAAVLFALALSRVASATTNVTGYFTHQYYAASTNCTGTGPYKATGTALGTCMIDKVSSSGVMNSVRWEMTKIAFNSMSYVEHNYQTYSNVPVGCYTSPSPYDIGYSSRLQCTASGADSVFVGYHTDIHQNIKTSGIAKGITIAHNSYANACGTPDTWTSYALNYCIPVPGTGNTYTYLKYIACDSGTYSSQEYSDSACKVPTVFHQYVKSPQCAYNAGTMVYDTFTCNGWWN